MRPEDWERAEELFHSLAPLDEAGRAAALAEILATDPGLGSEVSGLLAAHDSDGVLDRLTAKLAPEPLGAGEATASLTRTRVGQYEIGVLIGRGGMGDVYRARDTRLGRDVALKFLPRWLDRDPSAHDRFLVEARIVSAIDHPNVCTVHELGETQDGRLFFVMPLYEGATLKQRLADGPLTPEAAVDVALQSARGLRVAHEHGIVHRDIKPANLLLTDDGRVKILDFGVAKLADVHLTRTGETPGTASYMSPEQRVGDDVDERSDLWSLGAVLFEMLTGNRPTDRAGVREGLSEVPASLAEIVEHLLAESPDERYPDARSLAQDLALLADGAGALSAAPAPSVKRFLAELKRRNVFKVAAVYGVIGFAVIEVADAIFPRIPLPAWTVSLVVWLVLLGFPVALVLAWAFETSPGGSVRRTRPVRPSVLDAIVAQPARRRWPVGLAGALGGALVVIGALWTLGTDWMPGSDGASGRSPAAGRAPGAVPAVAVMPFRAIGLDPVTWQEGIADMLAMSVDATRGLRKIDPAALASILQAETPEDRAATDVRTGLRIGREVGARWAVLGSAVRLGDAGPIRLAAEVYDVDDGRLRGSAHVDGAADDFPSLVDELSLTLLRDGLLPVEAGARPMDLRRMTTSSLEALHAYIRGESLYRRGLFERAVPEFRRAVELDSTFARALYRLVSALGWSGRAIDPDQRARLSRLTGDLPERDSLLLSVDVFGGPEYEPIVDALTRKYPDDADGWVAAAEYAWHTGGVRFKGPDEYRGALTRAARLAPHYAEMHIHLIEDAFARLDSAALTRLFDAAEAVDPGGPFCPQYRLVHDLRWGDPSMRRLALSRLDSLPLDEIDLCGWVTLAAAPELADAAERAQLPMLGTGFSTYENQRVLWRMLQARLMRGQPSAARRVLGRARANARLRSQAAMHATMLELSGYDGADDTAAPAVLRAQPALSPYLALGRFWLGARAIRDGRWEDLERIIAELDAMPARPDADPRAAREAPLYMAALAEFARLERGDWSRLDEFEAAETRLPPVSFVTEFPAMYLRYEVGQGLFEQGRLAEAERYFLSLYPYAWTYYVPAQYYLGEIYEQLDDPEKAREHYRIFVEWWKDADPALQPWVQRGREALARVAIDAPRTGF